MTRIRFDENLSPRIVAAIREMGLPSGVEIGHPNEQGLNGAADVDWLRAFKAGGGRCIVTGDPKMRGRINERMALQASGLIAIFPPRKGKWYESLGRYGQAAYWFRWLPEIMRLASEAEEGEHFQLPPTFDLDPGKVQRLRPLRGPDLEEVRERHARKKRAPPLERP